MMHVTRRFACAAHSRLLVVFAAAAALVATAMLNVEPAEAAPPLQFPWPPPTTQRISGSGSTAGNGYNCATHDRLVANSATNDNADYHALDFPFPSGQPISAAAGGVVLRATDNNDNYGKKVVIDHGGGYITLYAHLNEYAVSEGARIGQGAVIGFSGNTGGLSTGPHLHFHAQSGLNSMIPEPMSGKWGFSPYGACTGTTSPWYTSKPSFNRDFNGNWCPDVMARASDTVRLYPGNCAAGFGAWAQIGSGFSNPEHPQIFHTPDFDGNGCPDMIAASSTGILKLYKGTRGGGFLNGGAPTQIGSGFNAYLNLMGPGDFDGDGCNDVMARDNGLTTVYLWRGACGVGNPPFKNSGLPIAVGSGFQQRDKVWPVGDFEADGCLDLMARDSQTLGNIFLYHGGCGDAGYWRNGGVGTPVGGGFFGIMELVGPGDFNQDACTDLIRRTSNVSLYRGNCWQNQDFWQNNGIPTTMTGSFSGITWLVP